MLHSSSTLAKTRAHGDIAPIKIGSHPDEPCAHIMSQGIRLSRARPFGGHPDIPGHDIDIYVYIYIYKRLTTVPRLTTGNYAPAKNRAQHG